jgi:signal transduction histidine kinase
MPTDYRRKLAQPTVSAYACICVTFLLVVSLGVWDAYREMSVLRSTLLKAEIGNLRTLSLRPVGHIESDLEDVGSSGNLSAPDEWMWLAEELSDLWAGLLEEYAPPNFSAYAAIVDLQGNVVLHSDPNLTGGSLPEDWFDREVGEASSGIYEVTHEALTGGRKSYGFRIPVVVEGNEVAGYLAGFDALWLDEQEAAQRNGILLRSALVIGGILLVVSLAALSLYSIANRSLQLRNAVNLAHFQRISELGQLAGGLAHEIRNPLHAIRLNLHALERVHSGECELSPEEMKSLTRECNQEIERVNRLMQELLGFATPEQAHEEDFDLRSEVDATVNFVRQDMQRKQIKLATHLPAQPVLVHMDSGRIRQVLLNLLMNAKDAVEDEGKIDVAVRELPGQIELTVSDNGCGIPPEQRSQIFDPFYTTKDAGTGLGLALVKRFISEADGFIQCESDVTQGTRFRVVLPNTIRPRKKDAAKNEQ